MAVYEFTPRRVPLSEFKEPPPVDVTGELEVNATGRKGTAERRLLGGESWVETQERKGGENQVKVKVFRGHTDAVSSCQFFDADSKILSGSHDKTIILWDSDSGANLQAYQGHEGFVTQARASQDTSRFVSSSWDKTIRVWDFETGEVLWSGNHGGMVTCCNFSHDNKIVVSGSDLDCTVKLWDAQTGTLLHEIKDLHSSTVTSVQFSPQDDRIITTSMDKSTKFWDLKTQLSTISLKGHVNVISDASIARDERKLATVAWDKQIHMWDISTGMYRSQGPSTIYKAHEGSISSCHFSPDGATLVTGGYDTTVALWDVENSVLKLRLQGHTDWVEDVCHSTHQKWLLSCSKDKTVRMWNIEESDSIPSVLENRRSIGLKIFTCSDCGKPFSMAEIDSRKKTQCVFCRLQAPDRNIPELEM